MTDEERIVEGLKRIESMNRKRGHATCWHAENKFQGPMEVFATRCWAEEMNRRRHSIATCKIKDNRDDPPDVFAEMDGKTIGIEVTELIDKKAIDKHPKTPPAWEISGTGPACTR